MFVVDLGSAAGILVPWQVTAAEGRRGCSASPPLGGVEIKYIETSKDEFTRTYTQNSA